MSQLNCLLIGLLMCLALPSDAAYIERHVVSISTDGSGDDTEYTAVVTGCVLQVKYTPGASPIDTNGDLDITGEVSGVVIANHDNIGTSAFTKVYLQATHGVDGSASLYAAGGEPVEALICVANERIKVVIANGAASKTGDFYIYVGGY